MMKTKMSRVKKKTKQIRKRRITRNDKKDGERDGEFTESEGEEEELSFTPATLNSENLTLGENELGEQGADNTQEVDTLEDNNVDRNGDVNAYPTSTWLKQEHQTRTWLKHEHQLNKVVDPSV